MTATPSGTCFHCGAPSHPPLSMCQGDVPHADDVAPCQFSYGAHYCESDNARRYEARDGGEVWLCIKHRGWLPALGLRSALTDGEECAER